MTRYSPRVFKNDTRSISEKSRASVSSFRQRGPISLNRVSWSFKADSVSIEGCMKAIPDDSCCLIKSAPSEFYVSTGI